MSTVTLPSLPKTSRRSLRRSRAGVPTGDLVRRLWLKLHHRGADYYWHCHKQKKLPPIDLPKAEFDHALWPNKGLTFGTACDINGVTERIRGAGEYEVECGRYIITAYWRTSSPNNDSP